MSFLNFIMCINIFNSFAQTTLINEVGNKNEIKEAVKTYDQLVDNKYSLFMHKRTFLLPFSYNQGANDNIYAALPDYAARGGDYYNKAEAEFQISFFLPIRRKLLQTDWDLMFAYTHHAWWQLYNSKWSKPFRETNYTPEFFVRKVDADPIDILSFKLMAMDFGFVHQSNGQFKILSRSWDRIFTRLNFTNELAIVSLMFWYRLPEKSVDDDNPNIEKYLGVGEISIHKSLRAHSIELTLPFAKRPGVNLQYSYPWYENYRFFMSVHYGYGSSLIEYNQPVQRIAIGITLESFMDSGQQQAVR